MTVTDELAARAEQYLMPNYGKRRLAIVRGQGTRVWDAEGREYLDFLSGIAVNNLGHCHPAVVEAVREQAAKLTHCSNLYLIESQVALAERLCRQSGLERAFFCNSGAEAIEACLKLIRRTAHETHGPGRQTIIAFDSSFHGRTYGAMSATWGAKIRRGFGQVLPGVRFARFNDLESVDEVWGDDVCGVLVEPVQGEGGVRPASQAFLSGLRERCDARGALLAFDEIQCGMGRCGSAFAYQQTATSPDILVLAKALGGGFPLGAVLASGPAAEVFQPGAHGSTFGGNPVACAAANAVCDIVFDPRFLEKTGELGCRLWERLSHAVEKFSGLDDTIRGLGLMIGLVLTRPGSDIVPLCQARGLLVNCTVERVLRFLPPLTVSEEEIEEAGGRLEAALEEFTRAS